jgi:hypothetical protein
MIPHAVADETFSSARQVIGIRGHEPGIPLTPVPCLLPPDSFPLIPGRAEHESIPSAGVAVFSGVVKKAETSLRCVCRGLRAGSLPAPALALWACMVALLPGLLAAPLAPLDACNFYGERR